MVVFAELLPLRNHFLQTLLELQPASKERDVRAGLFDGQSQILLASIQEGVFQLHDEFVAFHARRLKLVLGLLESLGLVAKRTCWPAEYGDGAAVDRGQLEAARAVGLKPLQVISLVIMPQALRIIIPPMISQFLNLTKNSSLALAIGYQDVFSVGKIAINQAGRAVPVFAMIMITYLTISLLTSLVLNIYNRRIQFVLR